MPALSDTALSVLEEDDSPTGPSPSSTQSYTAFVTSDNGLGFGRLAGGTWELAYTGPDGHDFEDDVTQVQPADFGEPSKITLLPDFGTASKPAWSWDGGKTWTNENPGNPSGFQAVRGMAKFGLGWNVDEDGFIWVIARQVASPNHRYVFKSTDEKGTAWVQKWNGTASSMGWTSNPGNVYVTGGKLWWLDGFNNKLKRVDVEDGTNYAEWDITLPDMSLSISRSSSEGTIHLGQVVLNPTTHRVLWSGGDITVPRTGTYDIHVNASVTWTIGPGDPDAPDPDSNCFHTLQVADGDITVEPPGFGGYTAFDFVGGANNEDAHSAPGVLEVGGGVDDVSGYHFPASGICGDEVTVGYGIAYESGDHDPVSLSCGSRIYLDLETIGGNFQDGAGQEAIFSGVSIDMTFVPFTTLSGYVLNGWHGSNKLVAWSWINDKPVLGIDISGGTPAFTWSDYSPFGSCHGPYDISPLADGSLVANTLFIQSPNDVNDPISHPDQYLKGSIWRSSDGGATWTEVVAETVELGNATDEDHAGLDNEISCVAPDPTNGDVVYVAMRPPYVFRSVSSGGGFTRESVPMPVSEPPFEWCGVAAIGAGHEQPGLARYPGKDQPADWGPDLS